jgi:hypothetical protein
MPKLVLNNALVSISHQPTCRVQLRAFHLIPLLTSLKQRRLVIRQKREWPRLADNSVSFEFHQDYAVSSVEATIYPLLGTAVACEVRPVNTSVSATNPKYNFSVLISEWTPLNGAVGELATASVTWPISGEITKSTS